MSGLVSRQDHAPQRAGAIEGAGWCAGQWRRIEAAPALRPARFAGLSGFLVAALLVQGTAVMAASWPFEGVWDCEVGIFTFTGSSYDAGDEPMPIVDIAPEGDTFTLTFDDNYQLSLAMNPDQTMTWFSPVSGDSFLCRRQE